MFLLLDDPETACAWLCGAHKRLTVVCGQQKDGKMSQMPNFSDAYLQYIARRYSTHSTTTTLWEAAGGNIAEIEDQVPSFDRWTRLLRLAENGAVRPLDLTLAALGRDPHNPVLLSDLQARLPEALQRRADEAVRQILQEPRPDSAAAHQALAQLGDHLDDTEVAAATVVATEKAANGNNKVREVIGEVVRAGALGLTRIGLTAFAQHLGLPPSGNEQ